MTKCKCVTASGKQCSREVTNGKFCWQHTKKCVKTVKSTKVVKPKTVKSSKTIKPKTVKSSKIVKPKTAKSSKVLKVVKSPVKAPEGFPKDLMLEIFMNLPPKEAILKCANTKACDDTFWNNKLNKDYSYIVGVKDKRSDPKLRYRSITSAVRKFEKKIDDDDFIIMSVDYMILAKLWHLEEWVKDKNFLGAYDLIIRQTNHSDKFMSEIHSFRGTFMDIIEDDIPKKEAIKRYVLFELISKLFIPIESAPLISALGLSPM